MTDSANPGLIHADLLGGQGGRQFRANRVDATGAGDPILCSFKHEGTSVGPLVVADVSPTGIGIMTEGRVLASPGSPVIELTIEQRGRKLWDGEGAVVYQVDTPAPRIGIRFTSSLFDVAAARLGNADAGDMIADELRTFDAVQDALPVEWRAAVAELRLYLELARRAMADVEKKLDMMAKETSPQIKSVNKIIQLAHKEWGPRFYSKVTELHAASKKLDPAARELGRTYATRELLPLLKPCPMHQRAQEKPRGYAGDYRLMTLYFRDMLEGDSLYAKFLHYTAQRYTLGHTVVARTGLLREAVQQTVNRTKRTRILSLACGPAIELRHWIRDLKELNHPVELLLVDQDDEALAYLYRTLNEELVTRHHGRMPIELRVIHSSVRQFLKPRDAEEERLIKETLHGVDLLYSAGLYDYLPAPVATSLTQRLYNMLAPGGRLLIGNLKEAPDTSWVMDYVLSWFLEYREPEDMKPFAASLKPAPANSSVITDQTGYCMFLDVTRPA